MRASLELQRSLVAALEADSRFGRWRIPIFDGPFPDARPPYLSIGEDVVTSRHWQGGEGHEHRFQLSLWDARPAHASMKEMLADVTAVVMSMPRSLGGNRLTALTLARSLIRRGQRNWMEGRLEFRALSVVEN